MCRKQAMFLHLLNQFATGVGVTVSSTVSVPPFHRSTADIDFCSIPQLPGGCTAGTAGSNYTPLRLTHALPSPTLLCPAGQPCYIPPCPAIHCRLPCSFLPCPDLTVLVYPYSILPCPTMPCPDMPCTNGIE